MTVVGRSRRRIVLTVALAVLLVGAGVGATMFLTAGQPEAAGAQDFDGATDEVVLGDLEGTVTETGTLRFADPRTIQSGGGGVVTAVPTPGSVITLGGALYSIDNSDVILLRGKLPAWREFALGMDEGPDVRQLEKSLRDLGFFDLKPDEQFTWATLTAIQEWQKSRGVDCTGRVPLGSVVFTRDDIRVGSVSVRVGDRVGPGTALIEASSTRQEVTLDVGLDDQELATVDTPVSLRLPGGLETTGIIVSVGVPTEQTAANGQQETVIPVVVTLDDPDTAAVFQEASVSVDLPSERREDVLSVAVGALLALGDGRFGVEVVDPDGSTRMVPVETGLFAGGRVEVVEGDLEPGDRVVVPGR